MQIQKEREGGIESTRASNCERKGEIHQKLDKREKERGKQKTDR